ncbi:MAG TPA: GNAT family N-acetyltransferase [Chthonomonadaceae bacterium]|nr:GNAT family N-acetyltransferase [Chthonomonadaceae bacterium]
MDEQWLERIIEHEVAYFAMLASCERTAHALFLGAQELPEYREGNRALRLRCAGRPPEAVASMVVEYYGARGLPASADVDPIATSEGIGDALRALGVRPTREELILMRYAHAAPPAAAGAPETVEIVRVPNETGAGEASDWINTATSDDVGWPDEAMWRAIARHEAAYRACTLFLARVAGRPAAACDLFQHAGWGRIDSVATHAEFRRRGIGGALVARAIRESLTSGNSETYLLTEPGGAAERLYRRLGFEPWHANPFRPYRA